MTTPPVPPSPLRFPKARLRPAASLVTAASAAPVEPVAAPLEGGPVAATPSGNTFRTIKVQASVHARLQAILVHVGQHGWMGVGSARDDKHTISAVLDEALRLLAERIK